MYLDPKTNTKICSNPNCELAGIPQPAENFQNNRSEKDGKSHYCKKCAAIIRKKAYDNDPNKVKKKALLDKQYRDTHKDKKREMDRAYKLAQAKYNTYFDRLNKYEEIRRDPDNPELLQVQCSVDQKWFNPSNQMVQMRIRTINGTSAGWARFYCSEECKKKCSDFGQKMYPKGFKNHISKKISKELSEMVFDRDDHTCQRCGKSKNKNPDLKLHCHHIDPVICNPIESADIDNCTTLCNECHNWVHENIPGCGYGFLVHIFHQNKLKGK